MKTLFRTLILLLLLPVGALAASIDDVRRWTAPDHTRVVFDISAPVEHKVFRLSGPERLVIDIPSAKMATNPDSRKLQDKHIEGLRYAVRKGNVLRLVLDLKNAVNPKTFLLQPNDQYGHRLVVDLYHKDEGASRVAKSTADLKQLRDIVIAIDAGHGGDDPGAIGSVNRTKEKHVTLAIAQRLKRLVDAQPGMRAILTRDGDYYVRLRSRMAKAREHRADLFVSIHADAFRDARVRGSSVYVLSGRGASSEAARWLAERENAADFVGGVRLDDKDTVLARVLLDLSQSAAQHASLSAANRVYRHLRKVGKVHGKRVQTAAFVVLKSPDIPSMLVETGFISNPSEERNLRNPAYQEKLARAILDGVTDYFSESPPPGTVLAQRQREQAKPRKHVIARGDTLSEIADQYQVSLGSLKKVNGIRNASRIRIGQVLAIPET